MAKEEDLILGDETSITGGNETLDIIDNQLVVIGSITDIDAAMYPDIEIEMKMALSYAFKIIVKAQKKLLKDI